MDLADELFALSTRTAVRALFDSELAPAAMRELHQSLDVFLKGIYRQALLPWAAGLPTPGNRRYGRAVDRWRAHTTRLIDTHRARARTGGTGANVLSHLLSARTADGSPVTDPHLHDQSTSLVLAASETTAAALAWSCHLLSRRPGTEQRLHAEARAVLAGRVAAQEDLPRLPLTARVVTEALRLYPPAWLIPRHTTRVTEAAGRRLPVGSTVIFSPYVVHRRADLFPEPDRFHPTAGRKAATRTVRTRRSAWAPTGASGRRSP
nr:cytochrome P450 [Streptomyces sp. ISL-11]